MKTLDMLAKSCEAANPIPTPDPVDFNKMSAAVVDQVARRVIELMSQQATDPEPAPEPDPEPAPEPEGGAADEIGQPGQVGG